MSKKMKNNLYLVSYFLLVLLFFANLGSNLLGFGERYGAAFFPTTYPIVGGLSIRDWTPWFGGLGFILGWSPFILNRIKSRQNQFTVPIVIFSIGIFILFIASVLASEAIWRDISRSIITSVLFGIGIGAFGNKLQQLPNS